MKTLLVALTLAILFVPSLAPAYKLILLGNSAALNQEDIFVSLFKTMETTLPYSDWCVEAE